jgi:hypothetical protein
MDDILFKAILAMDSYNSGYDAGILFGTDPNNSTAIPGVTQIVNALVYGTSALTLTELMMTSVSTPSPTNTAS